MRHLASYLKRQGISAHAFAALLNVTDAAVSRWLSGDRKPDRERSIAIAELTKGEVPAECWDAKPPRKPPKARVAA